MISAQRYIYGILFEYVRDHHIWLKNKLWGVSKLGFSPVLFRNELVSFQKELVLLKKNTQTFGLFILPLEKNKCWIFKNSISFLYQVRSWIGLISFLIVRFYSISKSYIIIKFSSENNKHLCLSLILIRDLIYSIYIH